MIARQPSQTGDGELPRLVMIMGMGRSGSTLLEVLLGNNPGMVNLGELTHVFQEGFLDDLTCPCGQPASRCEVWGKIIEEAGWDTAQVRGIVDAVGRVERHARFALVALGLSPERLLGRYRDAHARLLAAIGRVTAAQVVVDSSLYPGRALALSRLWPDRVTVICLSRSPAGLMTSYTKRPRHPLAPKNALRAALFYAYVGTCMRIAAWLIPGRVPLVKLEDLLADPDESLQRLEVACDLDLTQVRGLLRDGSQLEVGHVLVGNRMRKRGRIRLDPAAATPRVRGLGNRLAVWAMERCQGLLGL